MGNVVNSHRDLKTQLIISHLRKIYSDGCRGFRCRGVMSTRSDMSTGYASISNVPGACAVGRSGAVRGRGGPGERSAQYADCAWSEKRRGRSTRDRAAPRPGRGPARTLRRQVTGPPDPAYNRVWVCIVTSVSLQFA